MRARSCPRLHQRRSRLRRWRQALFGRRAPAPPHATLNRSSPSVVARARAVSLMVMWHSPILARHPVRSPVRRPQSYCSVPMVPRCHLASCPLWQRRQAQRSSSTQECRNRRGSSFTGRIGVVQRPDLFTYVSSSRAAAVPSSLRSTARPTTATWLDAISRGNLPRRRATCSERPGDSQLLRQPSDSTTNAEGFAPSPRLEVSVRGPQRSAAAVSHAAKAAPQHSLLASETGVVYMGPTRSRQRARCFPSLADYGGKDAPAPADSTTSKIVG